MTQLPSFLPSPHLPDPSSTASLRWGVVGPGQIARVFVENVLRFTKQRIHAVASTNAARAKAFAEEFALPRWYANYDDLFADAQIDVVYVATRQHTHLQPVLAAIAAGKHVLVEKPITVFPHEARQIRDATRAAGVFVMEALWSAYLPQSYVIRQLVADGVLGDITLVRADLGEDKRNVDLRLFEPEGGGASHDMGIYPLSFATALLPSTPTKITGVGSLTERGVDAELTIHLEYASGATVQAFCSMLSFSRTAAWINGTAASLSVEKPFPVPSTVNLLSNEFSPRLVASWSDTSSIQGHQGLCYQATAAAAFISEGHTESPIRNLDDSVRDIEIITTARHHIGAFYPGEPGHNQVK